MKHTIVVTAKRSDWQKAQQTSEYTQSTVDLSLADVGFIHATYPDQTMAMVNRKYTDYRKLALLLVDVEKVKVAIKAEGAKSGRAGVYPHIYGPLNVDAVYKVIELQKDADGRFVTPVELVEVGEEKQNDKSNNL